MAAVHSLHTDLNKTFSSRLLDMQQWPVIHCLGTLIGWRCVLTLRKWLGESSSGVYYEFDIYPPTKLQEKGMMFLEIVWCR